MSSVSTTRLPLNASSPGTWFTSSATLVTPKSKLVLRRPSFAAASNPPSLSDPIAEPRPLLPVPVSTLPEPKPLAFAPFPTCSINLITCASNSGKTQFLTRVIQQRQKFFQDWHRISRIIYVNGNLRHSSIVHPWIDTPLGLEVVSLALEDFKDPTASVLPFDVVVIDDLLAVSSDVEYLCKYGAHHHQLYLFLITQACLSSPLYGLLRLTHSLVLLFGNSATSRLAQHLVITFFLCSDTKKYLKAIFSIAERQQDVVILKTNAVASYRPHLDVLALTRVQKLFDSDWPYCFVYPELGRADNLWQEMASSSHAMAEIPPLDGDYLEQAFVLVPVNRLSQRSETTESLPSTKNECITDEEENWNKMAIFLENEISHVFPPRRWQAVKNLARSMLQCPGLCITSNFRMVHPINKPKQQVSIIDFLHFSSRKSGPGERQSDKVLKFKPLVNILLRHNVPESFIVNRLLLDSEQDQFYSRRRPPLDQARSHRRFRRGGGGGLGSGGGYLSRNDPFSFYNNDY